MRLIDADEFERRIKRYDTTDYADKALYNFAHNEMITMPTVCDIEQIRDEIDRQEKWLLQAGYTAYNVDIAFDSIKSVLAESEE